MSTVVMPLPAVTATGWVPVELVTVMEVTLPLTRLKVNGAVVGLRSSTMYFQTRVYRPDGKSTAEAVSTLLKSSELATLTLPMEP